MIENAFDLLAPVTFVIFAARRLLTYLHAYQQEDYDSRRLMRWIAVKSVFDKRLTAALLLITLPASLIGLPAGIASAPVILFFALIEKDPLRRSKKKLVLTSRAKRIYTLALLVCVLISCPALATMPAYWIIPVQLIPLTLLLANLALRPYEASVQKRLWNEAHAKLQELRPVVVAVTGSYGKTSVKHILGHILKSSAATLITPGSVNTPMGITRIIREQLEKRYKYFVVEMGAYGPGSIARLCRLAPPDLGVITSIGHAHYERFKSLETVARAKFELAEAVAEKNGLVVVNAQTLDFARPQQLLKEKPEMFLVVGGNGFQITAVEQTLEGTSVRLSWQGQEHYIEAPLYGEHHGINMALAYTAALALGLPEKHIVTALKSTPQIAHRLEVKPHAQGGLLIDDAYNSNPGGFRSALDLLDMISQGRRRILITPGMVELGKAHDGMHAEIGKYAAAKADVVIAVQSRRIASFVNAFREAKSEGQQIIETESFAQAQAWLAENGRKDDVILLENDLPDIYENIPKI